VTTAVLEEADVDLDIDTGRARRESISELIKGGSGIGDKDVEDDALSINPSTATAFTSTIATMRVVVATAVFAVFRVVAFVPITAPVEEVGENVDLDASRA
jgi:hypothetical protein